MLDAAYIKPVSAIGMDVQGYMLTCIYKMSGSNDGSITLTLLNLRNACTV